MSLADKDQAVGALILAVCVVVAVGYVVALVKPDLVLAALPWLTLTERDVRFWAVAVVVLIAFLAVMAIGAWIDQLKKLKRLKKNPKPKQRPNPKGEEEKERERVDTLHAHVSQ